MRKEPVSAREILAYAITHAPRGVKGGPYEAESGPPGEECDNLRDACRWPTTEAARECAVMYLEDHLSWQGDARVIRIVRKARPSPSEAGAVEVLRELVAKADARNVGPGVDWETIARARRVLASAGPDPMPVVRGLVMLVAGELDYDLAKSLDPETAEEPEEAERCMRDVVKRVTEQFIVERKAGGK